MPRPRKSRVVCCDPPYTLYKPAGVKKSELECVVVTLDEYEAMRLADQEGLYHEEASQIMDVSRQTFSNILASAHHKTAEALCSGKMLRIEGGDVVYGGNCFHNRCRRGFGGYSNSEAAGLASKRSIPIQELEQPADKPED